ncbi:S8 family serine peptidase [Micromonospora sp. NPDC049559]|uniref:S8 family serine peptidase n=1 Tax=Micromonospora sp. NPDC049559 TaxID=3155923 RepID=UPI003421658A
MVAAVLAGLWTVAVTVAAQAVDWLVDQVMLATGLTQPAWAWPVVGLVDAVLVGVPAGLLALLPRSAALRSAGRVWLLGALAVGLIGLLRAVPPAQHELYLGALAAAAALATWAVRRWARSRPAGPNPPDPAPAGPTPPDPAPAGSNPPDEVPADRVPAGVAGAGRAGGAAVTGFAVAGGLALLLPWLWLGALGGVLETLLAVLAALAVGSLAAAILDPAFWAAYGDRPGTDRRPVQLVLVGGLVAGVALLPLAAAIGHAGTQLAAMIVLPPVGFAAAALRLLADRAAPAAPAARPETNRPEDGHTRSDRIGSAPAGTGALRWLVGLATLGPLAFADPEEISLLLATTRDVPFWALIAAAGSLAVALLLGAGYAVGFGRARASVPRRAGLVAAAVVLLAGGAVYAGPGQPGFHGERLFVVLREQADLSGVPTGAFGQAGRDARAREVYRRLVATAERTQAGLRRDLDRLHLRYTPYYLVNGVDVEGGPGIRAWLARRPGVARVLLDQRLRPLPAAAGVSRGDAAAPAGPQWNIRMIGADRVREQLGVDGTGIVVGSSDSGVDGGHPALANGFRGGDDSWYDPWNGTRSPTDHGGHGTHTLATAVGGGGVGVAPGARWIGCVNLDRNLGSPAHYLDCLQFMLAPFPPGGNPFADGRPERAPHVLTNSWGCPPIEGCDATALAPATAALAAAGIFFVAAAGNTGPRCGSVEDPPAPYADVFTVGAVDRAREVTDFSSRGPTGGGAAKPDVVAPGAGVLSAMPGGTYEALDGTSMAAPHVAGVVALMWSANPALVGDLARTRAILRETAAPASYRSPAPSEECGQPENVRGTGLVDAYAAVRAAREAGPPR